MGSAPLRVMYLTPYYRPYLGGIERAIEELSHQIQQSPQVEAVGVLTTKYSFPRVAQPEWADRETLPDGVEVYRLPGFPRWSPPFYSVPLVWFSPRPGAAVPERVPAQRDSLRGRRLVLGTLLVADSRPQIPSPSGGGSRPRFVFTPSFHSLPPARWWLAPINAALCRMLDDIVPLTQQEARGLGRAYLTQRRKQTIIGWGAPLPDAEAVQQAANIVGEPLTILCVGRLGRHKAQLWLLDVYREARSSFNKPVQLVLVGRDEGDAEAIAAYIAEHGLRDEVVVTGEVSDGELARWYARADLFALFSHYEAFGLVFFEAMAYGAPVLSHDVGSNRELLHTGAVVTPRFDRQEAVARLTELVNDDDTRRQLGADARDYALGEFTWPAVAEKYLAVYRGG